MVSVILSVKRNDRERATQQAQTQDSKNPLLQCNFLALFFSFVRHLLSLLFLTWIFTTKQMTKTSSSLRGLYVYFALRAVRPTPKPARPWSANRRPANAPCPAER